MGIHMLSFKDFLEYVESDEDLDNVNEALTLQQRMKAKQTFRKNKSKIAMGRKRAEKRIANPEKLKKRARKQARRELEKKYLKDKSKDELSFAARQELEKKVDKKKAAIERIARKLFPKLKKAELEKKRGGGSKEK